VLARRQSARRHRASPLTYDEVTEAKLRQVYSDPPDWDWATASATLTAYASQPVLEATRAVEDANANVHAKLDDLDALRRMADSPAAGRADDRAMPAGWREVEAASAAAKDADDALEALIRADLARKPSDRGPLTQSAASPSSYRS
jgi:hypothetical protein